MGVNRAVANRTYVLLVIITAAGDRYELADNDPEMVKALLQK